MAPRSFLRAASRLRACPLCRSSAVSASQREESEWPFWRFLLLCGQCETWRGVIAGPGAALWLERMLRRGRRRMARALRKVGHVGADVDVRAAAGP